MLWVLYFFLTAEIHEYAIIGNSIEDKEAGFPVASRSD